MIMRMHTNELILTVIQIISTYAYIKIKNTDGIYLLHLGIVLSQMKMLGDGFRHAIEHTLQIIKLAGILDLNKDDISFRILRLDVHPVEFVIGILLISLALQYLLDHDLLAKKYGKEAFQHPEIRFLAKQTFNGPVETDVAILQFLHIHLLLFCFLFHSYNVFSWPNSG